MATVIESTIDALWNAIEANPDDLAPLLMLADEYLEQGNDDYAECLRWCFEKNKVCLLSEQLYWWGGTSGDETIEYRNMKHRLPTKQLLYLVILRDREFRHKYMSGFQNRTGAYLFLCEVWVILNPMQRQQCWHWNP